MESAKTRTGSFFGPVISGGNLALDDKIGRIRTNPAKFLLVGLHQMNNIQNHTRHGTTIFD
jgi:hypothetical protein